MKKKKTKTYIEGYVEDQDAKDITTLKESHQVEQENQAEPSAFELEED